MDPTIQQALARVEARFAELDRLLSEPDVARDPRKLRDLSRERSRLSRTVEASAEYKRLQQTLADDREALASGDAELAELAQAELPGLEARETTLAAELKKLLLPRDPDDDKNVIVEIRGGVGGEEAALFAADLYRMYSKYAEAKRWKQEVITVTEAEAGGYKEIIFTLEGDGVYRVQRVPATEASGRIHTSAATVAVLPEVEDVDVEVAEKDLRVDVYRAGGPGGQGVNTTDSAVRITHLPTGLVVTCQDERSQIKNRAKAMKVLRARLYDLKLQEQQQKQAAARKSQVSSGDRSAKIRTYNFPQSRVTDHRIGLTVHSLSDFMEGDIGAMGEALIEADAAERLAELAGG